MCCCEYWTLDQLPQSRQPLSSSPSNVRRFSAYQTRGKCFHPLVAALENPLTQPADLRRLYISTEHADDRELPWVSDLSALSRTHLHLSQVPGDHLNDQLFDRNPRSGSVRVQSLLRTLLRVILSNFPLVGFWLRPGRGCRAHGALSNCNNARDPGSGRLAVQKTARSLLAPRHFAGRCPGSCSSHLHLLGLLAAIASVVLRSDDNLCRKFPLRITSSIHIPHSACIQITIDRPAPPPLISRSHREK